MANKSKYAVSELLDYTPGNHGLTEETIYEQQPFSTTERVPIFSGSSDNETPMAWIKTNGKNKDGKTLVYFSGPCLILTKDGSAGLLTYKKEDESFTINHHACVLKVKEEWQGKLDLEWFATQYQSLFFNLVTSKSDNRIFSTEWLDRIRIKVPDYETVQIPQRNKLRVLAKLRVMLQQTKSQMNFLLANQIDEKKYPAIFTGVVSDVFRVLGGNSGLTDELIYHNQPITPTDGIEVLSGATLGTNKMGVISKSVLIHGKKLKIVNQEGILLTRKGYAGVMKYIEPHEVAINDDAYIIIPKADWVGKINLQWFTQQYASPIRACVTSQSDNATFNKDWLDKVPINIPHRSIQDAFAQKCSVLRTIAQNLEGVEEEIVRLCNFTFYPST